MANKLRIVIDTSVVVSAVPLPHSVPRQAVDKAAEACHDLVSSHLAS